MRSVVVVVARPFRAAWLKRLAAGCVLSTLAACAGTASKPATPLPSPDARIRVLVFNIHAGKDAAGVPNLAGVADLIRSTGADIALVQEVDRGTRRSGAVDQPRVLSDATAYPVALAVRSTMTAGSTESPRSPAMDSSPSSPSRCQSCQPRNVPAALMNPGRRWSLSFALHSAS
ncbi:hypothetical protein BH18ACI5_BH18ACI5_23430 [soil metagenome]